MPKKRHHLPFHKPASTPHPSLSSALTSNSLPRGGNQSSPSVNELLSRLRRNQTGNGSGSGSADFPHAVNQPLVSTPLLATAHGPGSRPHAPGALPPRAQPGPQNARRMLRRPPGPAPPPSWLVPTTDQPQTRIDLKDEKPTMFERPDSVDRLPGQFKPSERSLQHWTLLKLAKHWDWQVGYNRHHLHDLPPRLKSALLSYIAVHGQNSYLTIEHLRTVFGLRGEDGTTVDDVTYLDISGALVRSIKLKQLQHFLVVQRGSGAEASSTTKSGLITPEEESWETSADKALSTSASIPSIRFTNLTHLSLSHPWPGASWSDLLSLAPHLATLTHLSLAYWPVPRMNPNARAADPVFENSPFSVALGGSFYEAFGPGWSEAAGILRRLSKATYCLEWLDLEGCSEWIEALAWGSCDGHLGEGPEWTDAWRGMNTVIVRRGRDIVVPEWQRPAEKRMIETQIQNRREAEGCPRLRFVWNREVTNDPDQCGFSSTSYLKDVVLTFAT